MGLPVKGVKHAEALAKREVIELGFILDDDVGGQAGAKYVVTGIML